MIQYSVHAFEQSANVSVDVIFDIFKSVYIGTDVCNSVIILWQLHSAFFQVCVSLFFLHNGYHSF